MKNNLTKFKEKNRLHSICLTPVNVVPKMLESEILMSQRAL